MLLSYSGLALERVLLKHWGTLRRFKLSPPGLGASKKKKKKIGPRECDNVLDITVSHMDMRKHSIGLTVTLHYIVWGCCQHHAYLFFFSLIYRFSNMF